MKAKLLFKDKTFLADGSIVELILWQLPKKTVDRPHGYKYRLYYGDKYGNCLVRYDNETGKGDHKHLGEDEQPYHFVDEEKLVRDFYHDVASYNAHVLGGDND